MNVVTKLWVWLALASLWCASASASAGEVSVSNAPYLRAAYGQESDANSGPVYTQAISAPADLLLDKIIWWGFHSSDSLGAAYDHFVVTLDGVAQNGVLTREHDASGRFTQYTLDVLDTRLHASTLAILNDSPDVAWFWQSAQALGNPDAPDASQVGYALVGSVVVPAVPEPGSWAMLSLGLVGLGLRGRSRAARVRIRARNSIA